MKKFLVISQIFYIICTIPWLTVWGLSFMSMDNGFSFFNIMFVLTIGLYPVAVIVCSIAAWIIRVRRKKAAIMINLIPMLWIILLGIPLIIINLLD